MSKIILAAVLFTFYWIEFARIPRKLRLPNKPFMCDVCLPVWVALGFVFVPEGILDIIIVCTAAPVVYLLTRNLIINLLNRTT